jgi:hypothetical protein
MFTQENKNTIQYLKDIAGKAGINIDEPYPNPHLSTVSVTVKNRGDAQKLVNAIHETGANARYEKIDALVDDIRIVKDTVVLDLEELPTKNLPSGNALKFRIDNTSGNRMVAEDLKPRVLEYLKNKGKATTSEIYQDLNCGDIPLYLALHDLVNEKKIKGISPYDEKAEAGPKLYEYIPSGSLISKLSSEDIPIMSDARAKSQLRSITQKYTNDIYRNEEYWKPVNEMVKEIQRVIPTYSVVESSYDRSNPPKYKTWVLMGAIKNPDGKIRVVWSQIRANGAGTPEDPMKDYDLNCVTEVISPRNIQDTKQQEYLQVLLQISEENPAMPSKLSSLLDDIANRLEAKGLVKQAYQVDVVANTVEASQKFYTPVTQYDRDEAVRYMEEMSKKSGVINKHGSPYTDIDFISPKILFYPVGSLIWETEDVLKEKANKLMSAVNEDQKKWNPPKYVNLKFELRDHKNPRLGKLGGILVTITRNPVPEYK